MTGTLVNWLFTTSDELSLQFHVKIRYCNCSITHVQKNPWVSWSTSDHGYLQRMNCPFPAPPTVEWSHSDAGCLFQGHTSVLVYSQCASHVSGSVRAESVAASRVEQTLSEVASSAGSILHSRPGCQETWLLQAQIWLHLGKLTSIHVYLNHIGTIRKKDCYFEVQDSCL